MQKPYLTIKLPPPPKKKEGKKVSCICNTIKCFPFLVNIKIFLVNLIDFTNLFFILLHNKYYGSGIK